MMARGMWCDSKRHQGSRRKGRLNIGVDSTERLDWWNYSNSMTIIQKLLSTAAGSGEQTQFSRRRSTVTAKARRFWSGRSPFAPVRHINYLLENADHFCMAAGRADPCHSVKTPRCTAWADWLPFLRGEQMGRMSLLINHFGPRP